MANEFFDVALGKFVGMAETAIAATNDQIEVLLLKTTEADSALRLHATVSALLAAAGNVEADCTNYARKVGIAAILIDTTTQQRDIDIADIVYTALGGASNNSLVKLIVAFQNDPSGTNDDTTLIPITYHDYVLVTDGNDVVIEIHADGLTRSGVCP